MRHLQGLVARCADRAVIMRIVAGVLLSAAVQVAGSPAVGAEGNSPLLIVPPRIFAVESTDITLPLRVENIEAVPANSILRIVNRDKPMIFTKGGGAFGIWAVDISAVAGLRMIVPQGTVGQSTMLFVLSSGGVILSSGTSELIIASSREEMTALQAAATAALDAETPAEMPPSGLTLRRPGDLPAQLAEAAGSETKGMSSSKVPLIDAAAAVQTGQPGLALRVTTAGAGVSPSAPPVGPMAAAPPQTHVSLIGKTTAPDASPGDRSHEQHAPPLADVPSQSVHSAGSGEPAKPLADIQAAAPLPAARAEDARQPTAPTRTGEARHDLSLGVVASTGPTLRVTSIEARAEVARSDREARNDPADRKTADKASSPEAMPPASAKVAAGMGLPQSAATNVPLLSTETSAQIDRMIGQGRKQLDLGNIAAARQYFIRAAELGSPKGAVLVGDTYNPKILPRLPGAGVVPDEAEARRWYARAAELGAPEAAEHIRLLTLR